MPVTLNSTGITFSDATTQNTAASAGAGVQGTNITTLNSTQPSVSFPNTATAVSAVIGGGGGGGNRGGAPSPGGQGGLAYGVIPRAVLGDNFPVTIGAGGAGTSSQIGSPGGNSNFDGILFANGGNGGPGQPSSGNPGNGNANLGTGIHPQVPSPVRGNGGIGTPNTFSSGNPGKCALAFIG